MKIAKAETAILLARIQEHRDACSVLFQRLHALGGDHAKALPQTVAGGARGDQRVSKRLSEARPFATAEALGAVRRVFPDLDISDTELMDAISSEATSAGFEVDTPEPRSAARMKDALEKWDNEGGAIKNRAPVEAHGIRANDKDGKGRRAKAIKDRNELL